MAPGPLWGRGGSVANSPGGRACCAVMDETLEILEVRLLICKQLLEARVSVSRNGCPHAENSLVDFDHLPEDIERSPAFHVSAPPRIAQTRGRVDPSLGRSMHAGRDAPHRSPLDRRSVAVRPKTISSRIPFATLPARLPGLSQAVRIGRGDHTAPRTPQLWPGKDAEIVPRPRFLRIALTGKMQWLNELVGRLRVANLAESGRAGNRY